MLIAKTPPCHSRTTPIFALASCITVSKVPRKCCARVKAVGPDRRFAVPSNLPYYHTIALIW